MFQILAKAQEMEKAGRSILHFEIGDPDFSTNEQIILAAEESLRKGRTHYENSKGALELRLKSAEVTEKSRGFRPEISQLLVTPGANIQIFLALSCIANAGDEVIVPDPGFVSYEAIISYLGLVSVKTPIREENNFSMISSDIASRITTKTKAIIINSPGNPTGGITSRSELEKIFDLGRRNNLFILSDEIYARITYAKNAEFFSIASMDGCKERCVLINGLSKAYAMTGWRIGVMTAPSFLVDKMGLLLETLLSSVPGFIQMAAVKALSLDENVSGDMIKEYEERRNILVSGLNSISGFSCLLPEGAFYAFPNISKTGFTDEQLAEILLEKCGIAVVPGSYFGPNGSGHIRFSYVSGVDKIDEAISRMKNYFN
jgi:aspartate/methionine/tyrosine aminotransferase